MEEEERTEESKKNISEKWLESIRQSLERLESYEMYAREGCEGIIEYCNLPPNLISSLELIQLKNASFWISEFKNVFTKCKSIINDTSFEKMEKELISIEKFLGNKMNFPNTKEFNNKAGKEIICWTTLNDSISVPNKVLKKLVLTDYFYMQIDRLSALRSSLIQELQHILFRITKPIIQREG